MKFETYKTGIGHFIIKFNSILGKECLGMIVAI